MNHRFAVPLTARRATSTLRWIVFPVLAWLLAALLLFWFSHAEQSGAQPAAAAPPADAAPETVFHGA